MLDWLKLSRACRAGNLAFVDLQIRYPVEELVLPMFGLEVLVAVPNHCIPWLHLTSREGRIEVGGQTHGRAGCNFGVSYWWAFSGRRSMVFAVLKWFSDAGNQR